MFLPLLQLFMPYTCQLCNKELDCDRGVCLLCISSLPIYERFQSKEDVLSLKFKGQFRWEAIIVPYRYAKKSQIQRLIYALKYQGKPSIGLSLGRYVGKYLMPKAFIEGVDVIVPVPLSMNKRKLRGYNQAVYIAKGISEECGVMVRSDCVLRKDESISQTTMNRWQRFRNITAKDFMVSTEGIQQLKGKHVVIVDDILTTGSTALALGNKIRENVDCLLSILVLAAPN